MPRLAPTKVAKHGKHVDKWWPGLIESVWYYRPVEIRRERKYAERNHRTMKSEAWLIILRWRKHTVGVKWDRDK